MIGYVTEYAKKYANIIKQYPNDPIIEIEEWDDPREPTVSVFATHESGMKFAYRVDRSVFERQKPKHLRCQYCGRIALTERSTCEGCGAVLPWEMSYEE